MIIYSSLCLVLLFYPDMTEFPSQSAFLTNQNPNFHLKSHSDQIGLQVQALLPVYPVTVCACNLSVINEASVPECYCDLSELTYSPKSQSNQWAFNSLSHNYTVTNQILVLSCNLCVVNQISIPLLPFVLILYSVQNATVTSQRADPTPNPLSPIIF